MKTNRALFPVIFLISFVCLTGFSFIYLTNTRTEYYSEYETTSKESDLLESAVDVFEIDVEQWNICTLDTIAITLKETFPEDIYQKVSELIYEEYYNSSLERGLSILILISKDSKKILIISDTSSKSIIASECSLSNLEELPLWIRSSSGEK